MICLGSQCGVNKELGWCELWASLLSYYLFIHLKTLQFILLNVVSLQILWIAVTQRFLKSQSLGLPSHKAWTTLLCLNSWMSMTSLCYSIQVTFNIWVLHLFWVWFCLFHCRWVWQFGWGLWGCVHEPWEVALLLWRWCALGWARAPWICARRDGLCYPGMIWWKFGGCLILLQGAGGWGRAVEGFCGGPDSVVFSGLQVVLGFLPSQLGSPLWTLVFTEEIVSAFSQTVSETDFVFQSTHLIIRSYSKLFRASEMAF